MFVSFGRSLPVSLPRYFNARSGEGKTRNMLISMGNFASSEGFAQPRSIAPEEFSGQPITIFQSFGKARTSGANDYLTQLAFAGQSLKNNYGAGPLWAVVPFGPYARQDQPRPETLDSVGCEAACDWLSQYFKGITTIEVHSPKSLEIMKKSFGEKNVFNLDPTDLYLDDLFSFNLQNPVVVSPDNGANVRADTLANKLGADRFFIDKGRKEIINVTIKSSHGDVAGRDAILVDDMADTFGTAVNAIDLVRQKGASRVFGCFAHPVLSEPAWDRIGKLIHTGSLDHIAFINTIARNAEFEDFEMQYGYDVAEKIAFLGIEEMLYRHVVKDIAPHPAMRPEAKL